MLRSPFFLPHFAAEGIAEDFEPCEVMQHISQQNGYFHNIFGPPHAAVNGLFQQLAVKFRDYLN